MSRTKKKTNPTATKRKIATATLTPTLIAHLRSPSKQPPRPVLYGRGQCSQGWTSQPIGPQTRSRFLDPLPQRAAPPLLQHDGVGFRQVLLEHRLQKHTKNQPQHHRID